MENCALCASGAHPTEAHAVLEALDRHTELLAQLAEELAPKRYDQIAASVGGSGGQPNTQATVVFPNQPGGANKIWLVERVFVWTGSAAGTTLVYKGEGISSNPPSGGYPVLPTLMLEDGTTTPITTLNQVNPIQVKGNQTLAVQWTGLTAASPVFAKITYRLAWQAQD